nr:glycoside hydrolase family protein [Luteibacter sp. 9135]
MRCKRWRLVRVLLTANQRIVLASLVFNLGAARFMSSTLLRLLNQGDYASVPRQLARWNKENLRSYFDAEAYLRDMKLGGDVSLVEFDGTVYAFWS